MKILYHILNPHVNAAERWIFDAWRDGFLMLGHQVDILTFGDDFSHVLLTSMPDLFITDLCVVNLDKHLVSIQKARAYGVKVAMWVHWPPVGSATKNKKYLQEWDVADIYFGEREGDSDKFFSDTGKVYHCIPQAANSAVNGVTQHLAEYESDILYIGTRLPKKRWLEENVLRPLMADPKIKVTIIGLGWERRDFWCRVALKFCKLFGFAAIKERIEKKTVKIAANTERFFYASSKICLNFHEREVDGTQPHYIVNQRTFKIPACGGFQICDDVPAINKYFTNDEIVLLPLDKDLWLSTIYRYLEDNLERQKIAGKGQYRALKDHMSTNRCKSLLRLVGLE